MSSTGGRWTEGGGLAIDAAGVVGMLNGNIRESRRARQSREAPGNTDCVETKRLMLDVDTVRPPTRIYRLLEDGYEGSMFGRPEGRGPAATIRSQAGLTGGGSAYHVRLHKKTDGGSRSASAMCGLDLGVENIRRLGEAGVTTANAPSLNPQQSLNNPGNQEQCRE